MDERVRLIQSLEEKKRIDTETRNRLLEGLGENLFKRIGDDDPVSAENGSEGNISEEPKVNGVTVLAEYRRLNREISESTDIIKSLEAEIQRLKDLEGEIAVREEDYSRLDKLLEEVHLNLGMALLKDLDSEENEWLPRQKEEKLLAKIEEQESMQETLKKQNAEEGGVFNWLGTNARLVFSGALLQKNRSALHRFYQRTGEEFLNNRKDEAMPDETAEIAGKALEIRKNLSSLSAELADLRNERKKIGDIFGAEGSPSRRIQGLEKHIAHVKGEIPGVCRSFGSLAAESEGDDFVHSLLAEEDEPVLEKEKLLKFRISEEELDIQKIKAAISIDNEHTEIERMKKAIHAQKKKITAAEEAITGLEKQISKSELHIEELKNFVNSNITGS